MNIAFAECVACVICTLEEHHDLRNCAKGMPRSLYGQTKLMREMRTQSITEWTDVSHVLVLLRPDVRLVHILQAGVSKSQCREGGFNCFSLHSTSWTVRACILSWSRGTRADVCYVHSTFAGISTEHSAGVHHVLTRPVYRLSTTN